MTKRNKMVSFMQRLGSCFIKKSQNKQSTDPSVIISIDEMTIEDQQSHNSYDFDLYLDQLLEQDTFLIEKFKKNASLAQPEQSDLED